MEAVMTNSVRVTEAVLKKWKTDGIPGRYMDTNTPGLGFNVSPKGKITAFFYGRMPGEKPTRHKLGEWGPHFSLTDIRIRLAEWRSQISQGINPKAEITQRRAQLERQKDETFANVVGEWGRGMIQRGRREKPTQRRVNEVRLHVVPVFGTRPLRDIIRSDIRTYLKDIGLGDRPRPAMANRMHIILKSIYKWAIEEELYGLADAFNPCDGISYISYGYKRQPNTTCISDEQFAAFPAAIEEAGYPWGPFTEFMLLTAARHGEAILANWSEIDLHRKIWTIPAEHTKTGHVCRKPLSDDAMTLLASLPRDKEAAAMAMAGQSYRRRAARLKFYDQNRIFGVQEIDTAGANAASARMDPKRAINAHMPQELHMWKYHWIRHTFRTIMSPYVEDGVVSDKAVELYLAHTEKNVIKATYDHHGYEKSMRKVAEVWAKELRLRMYYAPNVVRLKPTSAG
jgi:integrase